MSQDHPDHQPEEAQTTGLPPGLLSGLAEAEHATPPPGGWDRLRPELRRPGSGRPGAWSRLMATMLLVATVLTIGWFLGRPMDESQTGTLVGAPQVVSPSRKAPLASDMPHTPPGHVEDRLDEATTSASSEGGGSTKPGGLTRGSHLSNNEYFADNEPISQTLATPHPGPLRVIRPGAARSATGSRGESQELELRDRATTRVTRPGGGLAANVAKAGHGARAAGGREVASREHRRRRQGASKGPEAASEFEGAGLIATTQGAVSDNTGSQGIAEGISAPVMDEVAEAPLLRIPATRAASQDPAVAEALQTAERPINGGFLTRDIEIDTLMALADSAGRLYPAEAERIPALQPREWQRRLAVGAGSASRAVRLLPTEEDLALSSRQQSVALDLWLAGAIERRISTRVYGLGQATLSYRQDRLSMVRTMDRPESEMRAGTGPLELILDPPTPAQHTDRLDLTQVEGLVTLGLGVVLFPWLALEAGPTLGFLSPMGGTHKTRAGTRDYLGAMGQLRWTPLAGRLTGRLLSWPDVLLGWRGPFGGRQVFDLPAGPPVEARYTSAFVGVAWRW